MEDKPAHSFNPWPYGLILFISGFAVLVISVGVWLGLKRFDLVQPDYYEQGVAYEERIEAFRRTRELAEKPQIIAVAEGVRLHFPASLREGLEGGTVKLYYPADKSMDLVQSLALDAQGEQLIDRGETPGGNWDCFLDWTQNGQVYALEQKIWIAKP